MDRKYFHTTKVNSIPWIGTIFSRIYTQYIGLSYHMYRTILYNECSNGNPDYNYKSAWRKRVCHLTLCFTQFIRGASIGNCSVKIEIGEHITSVLILCFTLAQFCRFCDVM